MDPLILSDLDMLDDIMYYFPPAQPAIAADFSHLRQIASFNKSEQQQSPEEQPDSQHSMRVSEDSRPGDSDVAPPGTVFDEAFASHFLAALEHRVTLDPVIQHQGQQWRSMEYPAYTTMPAHGPVHNSRRSKGAVVPPCAVCGKQFACQSKVSGLHAVEWVRLVCDAVLALSYHSLSFTLARPPLCCAHASAAVPLLMVHQGLYAAGKPPDARGREPP